MAKHRIYTMTFASVYPMYVQKAENKDRTQKEVDEIISWLTGYSKKQINEQIKKKTTLEEFFDQAPKINPNRELITGSVCGVKLAEIEDPLMKEVRYLDKLIDELAKGKAMDKILRN
ncbi:MAG: DUF2200 domain-containing protein [Micrococcaceae bacterium]